MLIFSLFFLLLLIYTAIRPQREVVLKKEATNGIKGMLALIVILGHCINYYEYGTIYTNYLGTFCVAVFFFISGYGMSLSRAKIAEMSFKQFLNTRIRKLTIPFVIALIIYHAVSPLFGGIRGTMDEFLTKGSVWVILPCCWYVLASYYLYFATFISAKAFRGKGKYLLSLALLVVAYILAIRFGTTWRVHWYNTVPCYVLGAALATGFVRITTRRQLLALSIATVIGACMLLYSGRIKSSVLMPFFLLFAIETPYLASMLPDWFFRTLTPLNKLSYALYLNQGIVLYIIFKDRELPFPVYCLLGVLIILLIAIVTHKVEALVNSRSQTV